MNRQSFQATTFGRIGFTLIELLAVIAIIAILLGLLLPWLGRGTGASRRMLCSNHFKQIGIALHNYHSAYNQLPSAIGGTGGGDPMKSNMNRLSGMVALLPFMEHQATWEQVSMESNFNGVHYPPMGPAPWVSQYDPWKMEIGLLRCAMDPGQSEQLGRTNYAFCVGDVAEQLHDPLYQRGFFAGRMNTTFGSIQDGLSNTIAMTEIGTRTGRDVVGQFAVDGLSEYLENPSLTLDLVDPKNSGYYRTDIQMSERGRGGCWADGAAGFSMINTILPPGSPSCAVGGTQAVDGIYSAGSYHQGGAHALMGDGAVVFISNSVDCGDRNQAPRRPGQIVDDAVASPFGVWGSMGTAASNDRVATTFD